MNIIHPSSSMILRNMVFREQEMIWQDPVDYSYLTYEYNPSLLEHDIKKHGVLCSSVVEPEPEP
jgi:hypothetical protein